MIDLAALREGENTFHFRAGPEEIGLEEEGAVYRKPVNVEVRITRTGPTATLVADIRTEVERTCGRCLSTFREELRTEAREALRIEGERARIIDVEYEGNPGVMPGPAGSISLDNIVREAILVCSPMQPVCRPDCRGLCPVCGADRNKIDCGCETEEPHPAWDALRELAKKQKKGN